MRDQLILLPGWGLGSAPLEPLRDALLEQAPHLNVQIEPAAGGRRPERLARRTGR
jgi:hypothetical protein